MRNMVEALDITAEYHDIFGTSDEEDADIDFEGSDKEVQEIDSDEDLEEEAEESDNEGNAADAIDEQTAWSNELSDFVISQFNSQCGIKVEVPPESKSDFFFNLIFSDELIDLIVRETNRYAQQKLAGNNTRLTKWHDVTRQELKAYFGICVVMGINNLPRLELEPTKPDGEEGEGETDKDVKIPFQKSPRN